MGMTACTCSRFSFVRVVKWILRAVGPMHGTMYAEKNFEIAVDIMVVNHPENEPTAKVQYIIMATRCAFLFSLYSMCTWIKQA